MRNPADDQLRDGVRRGVLKLTSQLWDQQRELPRRETHALQHARRAFRPAWRRF